MNERKPLNKFFSINPKIKYHKFRGGNIEIKKISTDEEVEIFEKHIWRKKSSFKLGTPWFETLKSKYCKNATQKQYRITSETIGKVLKKFQSGKATGTDLIVGFWYKNLMLYKADLLHIFEDIFKGHKELLLWLIELVLNCYPKMKTHT